MLNSRLVPSAWLRLPDLLASPGHSAALSLLFPDYLLPSFLPQESRADLLLPRSLDKGPAPQPALLSSLSCPPASSLLALRVLVPLSLLSDRITSSLAARITISYQFLQKAFPVPSFYSGIFFVFLLLFDPVPPPYPHMSSPQIATFSHCVGLPHQTQLLGRVGLILFTEFPVWGPLGAL